MSDAGGAAPAPEPEVFSGRLSELLAAELPGLGLRYLTVEGGTGKSPRAVKELMRELSGRIGGAEAIQTRSRPIPWAYRVFFRHIGLDPDETRTPIEELIVERLFRGGFKSEGQPSDAITIATAESGVALRAFDAGAIIGRLQIRLTGAEERLTRSKGGELRLPEGTLVIADEARALGLLFGETAAEFEVGSRTARTTVAAIRVKGVTDMAIEEALWLVAELLRN